MNNPSKKTKEILKEVKPEPKTNEDFNKKKPDAADPNENGIKPKEKVQPDLPDEDTPEE